jgi:hypothetical protein
MGLDIVAYQGLKKVEAEENSSSMSINPIQENK